MVLARVVPRHLQAVAPMPMQLPPRICSNCKHWGIVNAPNKDGYVERTCMRLLDPRDQKLTRGSDHCSSWAKKAQP